MLKQKEIRMKRTMVVFGAVAMLAAIGADRAAAQNAQVAPLRGKWVLTFTFGTQSYVAPARFKHEREGEWTLGPDPSPLTYRENAPFHDKFSIALEVPDFESPTGFQTTLLVRGIRPSDDLLQGYVFVIPDASGTPPVVLPGNNVQMRGRSGRTRVRTPRQRN